jgi:hypothetical protein
MKILTALVLAILPLRASAATTDAIFAAPRAYDGQHVEVTGRVEHLHALRLSNGQPYLQFSICSAHCLFVFAPGSAPIIGGQTITIRGTYYNRKNVGGYVVRRGIAVDPAAL